MKGEPPVQERYNDFAEVVADEHGTVANFPFRVQLPPGDYDVKLLTKRHGENWPVVLFLKTTEFSVEEVQSGVTRNGGPEPSELSAPLEPASALRVYDQAISRSPREPWLHFRRGQVLAHLKRPSEAEEALVRASSLGPGPKLAGLILKGLGYLRTHELGKLRQGLSDLERALKLDPRDGLVQKWLLRVKADLASQR